VSQEVNLFFYLIYLYAKEIQKKGSRRDAKKMGSSIVSWEKKTLRRCVKKKVRQRFRWALSNHNELVKTSKLIAAGDYEWFFFV